MSIWRSPVRLVSGESEIQPVEPSGSSAPSRNQKGEITMRFMILVKANKDSEAGVLPDKKILTEMGKFN
jgi:hypothetical protein